MKHRTVLWLLPVAGVAMLVTSWLLVNLCVLIGRDYEDAHFISRGTTLAGTLLLPNSTEPAVADGRLNTFVRIHT